MYSVREASFQLVAVEPDRGSVARGVLGVASVNVSPHFLSLQREASERIAKAPAMQVWESVPTWGCRCSLSFSVCFGGWTPSVTKVCIVRPESCYGEESILRCWLAFQLKAQQTVKHAELQYASRKDTDVLRRTTDRT